MIVALELRHALHVCHRMRESDRQIISQTRFAFDPEEFALERYNTAGLKCAALANDGTAVAIGGLGLKSPGVWAAWMLGTERMGECVIEIGLFARRTAQRLLEAEGGHRIEAHCAAEDERARRYAELMGMSYEGTRTAARSNRADLAMYAMTRGN